MNIHTRLFGKLTKSLFLLTSALFRARCRLRSRFFSIKRQECVLRLSEPLLWSLSAVHSFQSLCSFALLKVFQQAFDFRRLLRKTQSRHFSTIIVQHSQDFFRLSRFRLVNLRRSSLNDNKELSNSVVPLIIGFVQLLRRVNFVARLYDSLIFLEKRREKLLKLCILGNFGVTLIKALDSLEQSALLSYGKKISRKRAFFDFS